MAGVFTPRLDPESRSLYPATYFRSQKGRTGSNTSYDRY
jgi:hypothetical protein